MGTRQAEKAEIIETGTTPLFGCVCWCAAGFTACLQLSGGKSEIIKLSLPGKLKGGLALQKQD